MSVLLCDVVLCFVEGSTVVRWSFQSTMVSYVLKGQKWRDQCLNILILCHIVLSFVVSCYVASKSQTRRVEHFNNQSNPHSYPTSLVSVLLLCWGFISFLVLCCILLYCFLLRYIVLCWVELHFSIIRQIHIDSLSHVLFFCVVVYCIVLSVVLCCFQKSKVLSVLIITQSIFIPFLSGVTALPFRSLL